MGSRRSRLPGARARHVGCWLGACHDVAVPACRAVGMVGTGSFRPVAGTERASRLLWRRSPPRATSSGRRGAESRSAKLYAPPSGSIVDATKRVWRPAVATQTKAGARIAGRLSPVWPRPVSDDAPDWVDHFRWAGRFFLGAGFLARFQVLALRGLASGGAMGRMGSSTHGLAGRRLDMVQLGWRQFSRTIQMEIAD